MEYLIPVLQQIVQINPNVKFLASPWSAPAWMKTTYNGKQQLRGGKLKKEHFVDYAQYILNYFKEMEKLGLKFHSMTIQNEPLTEHNWPSMYMSKEDQYDFVENYLGPILTNNGYGYIKLIGYDHNCDNTEYPIYVARSQYIEGSAFHLYGGSIAALSTVYNATKKSVYFTEQWTDGNGDFGSDFAYHLQQIMLGTVNNMGKIALEWNVASDQNWDLIPMMADVIDVWGRLLFTIKQKLLLKTLHIIQLLTCRRLQDMVLFVLHQQVAMQTI